MSQTQTIPTILKQQEGLAHNFQDIKNLQDKINQAISGIPDNLRSFVVPSNITLDQVESKCKQTTNTIKHSIENQASKMLKPPLSSGDSEKDIPEILESYREYLRNRSSKCFAGNHKIGSNVNNVNMEGDCFKEEMLDELEEELPTLDEIQLSLNKPFTLCQSSSDNLPIDTCQRCFKNSEFDLPELLEKPSLSSRQESQFSLLNDISRKLRTTKCTATLNKQNHSACSSVEISSTKSENILNAFLDMFGHNSNFAKLLNQNLQTKNSNNKDDGATLKSDMLHIDQNNQVTRDKVIRSRDNSPSKFEEATKIVDDHKYDVIDKKLDKLEQQLNQSKEEHSHFMNINIQETLKKMWREIDILRADMNTKLNKMYLLDKKEKKILRNNISMNYQNIVKMYKQCQNQETVRVNDRKELEAEIKEVSEFLNQSSTKFHGPLNLSNFVGRHVDFVPVVLMLIMYLVTLILKY